MTAHVVAPLKRLARHSFVYTVGSILNKALFIALVPIYTRLLTEDDYGSLVLLNAGLAVLSVTYELGTTSSVMRLYFDFDDLEERRRYVGSVWSFMTLTACVATLVLLAVGPWILKPLFSGIPYWPCVAIMIVAGFFRIGNNIPQTLYRVREQSSRFVTLVIGQTLLLVVGTFVFIALLHQGLLGALLAILVQCAVFYALFTAFTLKHMRICWSSKWTRMTMAYGFPVMILHGGWWVLDASDRFILSALTSLDIVAVYSVGYVVGKALQMITTSINQAWTPFFFSIVKEEHPDTQRMFTLTATYFTVILALLGLAIAVFAREAVLLFGGQNYLEAVPVVPVVILASVCQGMFFVPSRGLFLQKKTGYFPLLIGISAAVNVGLNFALIPHFGMMGAAWATVAGYLSALILTFVIAERFYPIHYEVRRLVQALAFALVLGAAAQFFQYGTFAALSLRVALLASYPLLLWATQFFAPDEKRALVHMLGAVRRRLRLAKGE